jgi:hypothetical protein
MLRAGADERSQRTLAPELLKDARLARPVVEQRGIEIEDHHAGRTDGGGGIEDAREDAGIEVQCHAGRTLIVARVGVEQNPRSAAGLPLARTLHPCSAMRHALSWLGASALLLVAGCLNPAGDVRRSQVYAARAQEAAERGDYQQAERYRDTAERASVTAKEKAQVIPPWRPLPLEPPPGVR